MTAAHFCLLNCLGLMSFILAAQPASMMTRGALDARLTAEVRDNWKLGRGLDDRHAFRAIRKELDGNEATVTTAQQFFQGCRVLGGEAILRKNDIGDIEVVADALVRNLFLQVDPTLDPKEALAIAHRQVAPLAGYASLPETELVIYPVTLLVPREGVANPKNAEDFEETVVRHELAYLIHLEIENESETRHENLLVQAHTGEVLRQWSTLHTTSQQGVGRSQYSGVVSLNTNSVSAGFELRDMVRAGNTTLNMGGSTSSSSSYVNSADDWGDGANYSASSGTTSSNGQTAAVDAHYGMQVTWDFLANVLGRNGIDGQGRTVSSRVHYSTSYDNAFWSDSCFCMTYGDGSVFKTLTSLDVAAHEMGHGVCAATANLTYSGESGGLNEADSDIIGTMVEFYARGAQAQGSVVPDTGGNWTMGEQLCTAQFPNPLRYLYKPSLDGRSPDAWSSSLGSLDVHYSSGPMNRAFYFLSQGVSAAASSTSSSIYLPGGMTGLGNNKAFRIWWRTLSTKLTSGSNYLSARNGCIASAKELYGAGGPEEIACWNAFAAINVGTAWSGTGTDTTAPTVSAQVGGTSGTLTFTATATDNVGVTRVDYYVDGALKGSATTSPYSFAFNSTTVANGTHTLVAKALDAANNTGTSASVSFSVSNAVKDTTAPTVSAQTSGTSGTITFTAAATDNVGVTRVDYYVDGALKGSATTSPYSFGFTSTAVTNGTHSLVAKAYDAAGNVGTSAALSFTIANPDVTAPTVTAKVTGSRGTLSFTATATDNVGVTRVDYYVDGTLKGSATTSPYTFGFTSSSVSDGAHTLIAKALDAANNVGTSAAVSFSVDNTAPIVAAKASGTSDTIIFNATASDNVGVTRVDYYVDGTLKGSATTSPYAFGFASRTATNGTHSLVAKALDAAGNLGTSSSVTFNVSNDLTAPAVSAQVSGIEGTITFTATASDNVGVTRVDYYVDGTLKGSATTSPYIFGFTSTAIANGTHSLVAKALDAAGNVGIATAVSFKVSNPDTTAPTVIAKVTGLTGTLSFTATATDNVGVVRVDYYVDSTFQGSSTTASTYALAFVSKSVSDGKHNLIAKAYDAAGNVGTSATVAFTTDNTAPTVSAQVTGTSGTITFNATASDSVGVTRVDYYVDGTLKGSATASPYAFGYASKVVANGVHTLIAKAYDAAGNVGTSASIAFTVANPDTTAPTVTAKATGTSGTITFSATASDNVGVTRVDYYVDGTFQGSAPASPYTFAYSSTSVPNGTHLLVAKAYDAAGNVGTSATVSFSVSNSTIYYEVEPNDTSANVVTETITTIQGAISTGSDVDTFAIPLAAGKGLSITLTCPAGTYYGLRQVQSYAPGFLSSGTRVLTIPPPPPSVTQTYVYIQVYSLTGQGSTSAYSMVLAR